MAMSNYPGAIDEFRTAQNLPGILYDETDTTTVYAEDSNNATSAIVAIETELGTNPAGAFATVDDRLNNIDAAATILSVAHQGVAAYASGGYQALVYDHVFADTASGWDAINMQYTIPRDGAYMIFVSGWYASAFTATEKKIIITANGGERTGINNPNVGAYDTQSLTTADYFNEGDVIKAYLMQNSGSTQYTDDYYSVSYFKIIGIW